MLVLSLLAANSCRSRSAPPTKPPAPPTKPAAVASFHAAIEPVLARNCASAEGCHGEHPTHSVSLDLRSGHAYHALVSTNAKIRDGALRVAPGAPERSFLIDKLVGTLTSDEGKPMPLNPDTGAPVQVSPLPPGFVETVLTDWIARGALDN